MINQYKSLADCQLSPQCNQKLIDQFNYDERLRRRLQWRKVKRRLGLPKLEALLHAILDLRDEIREKRRSIDCVGNKWTGGPKWRPKAYRRKLRLFEVRYPWEGITWQASAVHIPKTQQGAKVVQNRQWLLKKKLITEKAVRVPGSGFE